MLSGLGEQTRLLLNDQGIPFEDYQFDRADWPKIKPTMVGNLLA